MLTPTLYVKKGKDLGERSVSVSSESSVRVKGPMIAMAVNMDVTSDTDTEQSRGR